MSRNQHGSSGLEVRTPLEVRMARHDRIRQMVDDEGRTFEEVSRLSEEELGAHISRQRARQIYDNVPRKPGRPWPR